MISKGTSASRFEVLTLAMWYLWAANEFGKEGADKGLETFLETQEIAIIRTLWVLGIDVKEEIQLACGVKITPINKMPDSRDKEHFLKHDFTIYFGNRAMPVAALTFECQIPKVFEDKLLGDAETNSQLSKAENVLTDVAYILNILDGVSCRRYYSTSYNKPGTPMDPFVGSGGGSPVYDIQGYGVSTISEDVTTEINGLMDAFQNLDEGGKKRFRTLLFRFSQAKRRVQLEDKLLDLGISLEMALLDDNSKHEQLALNFRLRGSWLIGQNSKDRELLHDQFKTIYNYRSEVAHSGILKVKKPKDIEEIRKSAEQYFGLASKVFKKLLIEGSPDWKTLLLGK
jgi:hypothetical protein